MKTIKVSREDDEEQTNDEQMKRKKKGEARQTRNIYSEREHHMNEHRRYLQLAREMPRPTARTFSNKKTEIAG